MTLAILKDKVAKLEQQLLAISSLNDICQQSMSHGNQPIKLESCAELLNHLIDPAMYQIEALRVQIGEMTEPTQKNTVRSLKCS